MLVFSEVFYSLFLYNFDHHFHYFNFEKFRLPIYKIPPIFKKQIGKFSPDASVESLDRPDRAVLVNA